jgi:hypothetical protein
VASVAPVAVYALVYLVEVVRVGRERGGWDDMYHATALFPPLVDFVLVVALALGIAQLVRISYRRICDVRMERFQRAHLADDLTETEVRLGIFELGELVGHREDESFVVLPLRGISTVAKKYSLRREELVEVYTRALIDTMDERRRAFERDEGPGDPAG